MKCDLCGKHLTEVDLAQDSSLCFDCNKNVFETNANHINKTREESRNITSTRRTLSNSLLLLEIYIFIAIFIGRALSVNKSDWFGIGSILRTIVLIVVAILLWKLTPFINSGINNNSTTTGEDTHTDTLQIESDYIDDLNKKMEEAGVDNVRDLELRREQNKSK